MRNHATRSASTAWLWAGALALTAGCSVIVDSTLAGRDDDGGGVDAGAAPGACQGQASEGSLCVLDGGVGVCRAGACVATTCGDGVVEGTEACEPMVQGAICRSDCTLVCSDVIACPDDGDACTIERCDPSMGCVVDTTTNDVDGDGAFAMACGGTDCDDANAAVYPGATETCDGVDNDCDPSNDAMPTYYPDCDGDGYAAVGAAPMMGCTPPTGRPTSCGTAAATAQWITRAPVRGASDCSDADARAFPGQRMFFETAVTHAPTRLGDFDFDCSGMLDSKFPISSASRPIVCDGPIRGGMTCAANPVYGPTISTPSVTPSCGDDATERHCTYDLLTSACVRRVQTTTTAVRVACH